MNNSFDAIVIGAGPAGMMAAGTAAQKGMRVLLLEKVWDGGEFVDENALSVAVGRLRAKLGEAPIKTVYGVGYTWEAGR